MTTTGTVQTAAGTPAQGAAAPRTRVSRKRRGLARVPRAVYPIRALWDAASEEERRRAQGLCATILEVWLGVTPKTEAARRLGMPPLRVWQLSQRAVAGMACGLLTPPRTRGRPPSMSDPENDPAELRKRIRRLERELEWRTSLIAVLRELPGNRGRELPPRPKDLEEEAPRTGSPPPAPSKDHGRPRTTRPKTPPRPRPAAAGGSVAAEGSPPPR